MLNQDSEETLVLPLKTDVEVEPTIKSIYYPQTRYGGFNVRSRLHGLAKEIRGNDPGTKGNKNG